MSAKKTIAQYLEVNLARWNELVDVHTSESSYNLHNFRRGHSVLHQLERDLLGDITGKKILHLQCHFGMDSISLLFEGAVEVVGVDFSNKAVETATQLATELQVNARFVQANVLELDQYFDEFGDFDIVFTSYGTIMWLPELDSWGNIINKYLKPGGKFLIVDAHPMSNVFDDETDDPVLKPRYNYFHHEEPIYFEGEGSYATNAKVENKGEYLWNHPISEIINGLTSHNMIIDQLQEYPTIIWQMYPFLVCGDDGWYHFPEDWAFPEIPLCFSLLAHKSEI